MASSLLPEKVRAALKLVTRDPNAVWKVKVRHGQTDEEYDSSYTNFKVIGNGSFGVVCLAKKIEKKEDVAIKIVYQDRRFKNRELQIMKMLSHQNIVNLKEYFYKTEDRNENDVYLNLVLEYVPDTVFNTCQNYIKNKQLIPPLHIKLFIYQLLRSLGYIHSLGVCHRDIKPQNLLLNPTTGIVKLCDFGSAKMLVAGETNVAYICSRYYRAPELLMGSTDYTTAVDIWSCGCVMAELLLGSPLFPGNNDIDQMVQIIRILGLPSKEEIQSLNSKYSDFRFPNVKTVSWSQIFPIKLCEHTIDLLEKLLEYSPKTRITALEALAHPYFDELRDPSTVYSRTKPLPDIFNFSVEELASKPALAETLIPPHAANASRAKLPCRNEEDTRSPGNDAPIPLPIPSMIHNNRIQQSN